MYIFLNMHLLIIIAEYYEGFRSILVDQLQLNL